MQKDNHHKGQPQNTFYQAHLLSLLSVPSGWPQELPQLLLVGTGLQESSAGGTGQGALQYFTSTFCIKDALSLPVSGKADPSCPHDLL